MRAIVQAIEDDDCDALCTNLTSYRELLTEHITREDEILYPYIDRGLTTSQVGKVFRQFEEREKAILMKEHFQSRRHNDVPRSWLFEISRGQGAGFPNLLGVQRIGMRSREEPEKFGTRTLSTQTPKDPRS